MPCAKGKYHSNIFKYQFNSHLNNPSNLFNITEVSASIWRSVWVIVVKTDVYKWDTGDSCENDQAQKGRTKTKKPKTWRFFFNKLNLKLFFQRWHSNNFHTMNSAKDLDHSIKDSGIIIINLCKAEFSEVLNYLERLKSEHHSGQVRLWSV